MNEFIKDMQARNAEILGSLADATAWTPNERMKAFAAQFSELSAINEMMLTAASKHYDRIARTHNKRTQKSLEALSKTVAEASEHGKHNSLADDFQEYIQDAVQRTVLALDVLRERGDIFVEHEGAGCPPVLIYDYEVVLDGADLERPSNYQLLRILPPEGCEIDEAKRPYIIIDPRAGHGGGIGGFKTDSQVGVALRDGHPVYFVAFRRLPEPGQTLADVTRAEAEFVREVQRRHPDSPKPVVTGNCQGGWATLLLAATNPDITGPICLNGAPVATWSGKVGENPMRYNGGVLGGAWQPMFWSDMGHGVFDGAHLVMNFELLNPSRNFFRKYYDLYSNVDTERERFLEFEKWWGGFFCLNEAEIRWIVEQLFIGNRLVRNQAQLEPGRTLDVKNIRAPIIVFASHGDNITPPQQALNWIVDSYADEKEIAIRGQRIVYMVHEQVGHLGIFVSAKIAKKEHTEVASTLETIEALAPGLYEMKIDDYEGDVLNRVFTVSFHERTLDDLRSIDDGRDDEIPFAAVARWSEMQADAYDTAIRPLVQAGVTPQTAEIGRATHPLRVQRAAMSSKNPAMEQVRQVADQVRAERKPADLANPFVQAERITADLIEQSLDMTRDLRDTMYELMFYGMWGTPWARWFGRHHQPGRTLKNEAELKALPEVRSALMHVNQGGFVEAVVRMLILLAESRGNVRRDRLERSSRVLTMDRPFADLSADALAMVIHQQTLICEFDREGAVESLPRLLATEEERRLAVEVAQYVPGPIAEMAPHTLDMLQEFRRVLELPSMSDDILEDPLARPAALPSSIDTAAE